MWKITIIYILWVRDRAESAGIEKYSQLIAINGKTAGSLEDIFEKLKDKQKLSMIFRRWASADNLLYEFFEVEYEQIQLAFLSQNARSIINVGENLKFSFLNDNCVLE